MAACSLRHAGKELLDHQAGPSATPSAGGDRHSDPTRGQPLAGWIHRRRSRRPASPTARRSCAREEHGLPIHGLLSGSRDWRVRSACDGPDRARLVGPLDFGRAPELLAAFPFPHTVALDAAWTRGLTIATTLTATGDVAVPVAFGFHPYLRFPVSTARKWRPRPPARRYRFADARGIPTGHHEDEHAARLTLGTRAFDDGFDGIADGASFSVAGGGRRLTMTFVSGYPAGQIFSPPGAQFVCFEPMTAPTNVLRSGDGLRRVAPGAAFTAVFRIAVAGE